MKLYCLTDLDGPPRELLREGSDGRVYKQQVWGPAPQQIVVFTLGVWNDYFETGAKVLIEAKMSSGKTKSLGALTSHKKCAVWEGTWTDPNDDITLTLTVEGQIREENMTLSPKNNQSFTKIETKQQPEKTDSEQNTKISKTEKKNTPKSGRTVSKLEVTPKDQKSTKGAKKDKISKSEGTPKSENELKHETAKPTKSAKKESVSKIENDSEESTPKTERNRRQVVNKKNETISRKDSSTKLDENKPEIDNEKESAKSTCAKPDKKVTKVEKKDSGKKKDVKADKSKIESGEKVQKTEKAVPEVESESKQILSTKDNNKPEVTPAELLMKPPVRGERKKRARMGGVDKTPEGPLPNKRKTPTTRVRNIKDMFKEKEKENEEKESQLNKSSEEEKMEVDEIQEDKTQIVIATNTANVTLQEGKGPSARWGHSLCMISEAEAVLIGGQGDNQQMSKDSIWLLDMEKRKWKPPGTTVTQGGKPEARMGHTAVYDPTVRSIYVFGGSKNKRWFNDVHVLDVDEWKWQLVKANGKAPTRAYHTASLYRHELWIFGGVFPLPDPQPDGCSNDIHVFSPMEESWYMPIVMGEKPIARSGHSATLLQDKLVVFGGWDYPVVYGDLDILDLGIVEWSKPKVNGTPPKARSWHASCALSGNRVLIHGGYDGNLALDDSFILNLDTLTWTSVHIQPAIQPKAGHAAMCLPYKPENKDKDEILVFGGGDNDGAFFDDLMGMLIPIERTPFPV